MPTSSSSWTATAPTIRPRSLRWSRRSAPALMTSSSPRARAASASRAAWHGIRFSPATSPARLTQAPLRRALYRHVRVSRHPPRYVARARHARDDLWLESRNADAGRAQRACAFSNCRLPIGAGSAASPRSRARLRGSLKAGLRIVSTFARVALDAAACPVPASARQDVLVGVEPECPDRRASDEQTRGDDEGRLPVADLGQIAEHDRRDAPPKLPAMFIMPDTVPEYLPPVSIGTDQDGPMVHSRKNIAAVRQKTAI